LSFQKQTQRGTKNVEKGYKENVFQQSLIEATTRRISLTAYLILEGGNFINVKRANFLYEHLFGSFFLVTCT